MSATSEHTADETPRGEDEDVAPSTGGSSVSAGDPVDGGGPAQEGGSLVGLYVLTFVGGIALWWLGATLASNALVPGPIETFDSFVEGVRDGSIWGHTLASLRRVMLGFVLGCLLAIPVGFLMGWYRWARGALEPWVQFFRTVPPLATIPLVIVLLGIGEVAKVSVIFLAAFLAAVIATFQGVRNIDLTLVNAARVLGAGDWTIFRRVAVPASAPYIFVGLRVALGSAWATLVASELIAASEGLGRMMQAATQFLDTPRIVVGIVIIGVLGFSMDRALLHIEKRATSWQETRR